MLIMHKSPDAKISERKKEGRAIAIKSGAEWGGRFWQTREEDRLNVGGAASRINSLLSLDRITLQSMSYIDAKGEVRQFMWRDAADDPVFFTAEQFLEFSIVVAEFVEDEYIKSWQ